MIPKFQFETGIEKKFRLELESRGYKRGIDFVTQFPMRNSFIIDFAFPTNKIAIEIDGEIWHSSPEAIKRDSFKNYILKRKGWKVFRFTGTQIDVDTKLCVDQVLKEILV